MIDIHSHLIYGVDDGTKTKEESIEILKKLRDNNITDVILTPHYIADTKYTSSKIDNIKIYRELKKELELNNIDINIYLGNEIYIDRNILNYVEKNEMCTLNNSEYILIELPMSGIYPDYVDIISNMISEGCKVILAHPERYTSFQKDFNKILELNEIGVLFQCNYGSILGEYGHEAKKCMKAILKNKLVSFMGTDIHKNKNDYNYIEKSIKKIGKYYSTEEIDAITTNNAKKIIEIKK